MTSTLVASQRSGRRDAEVAVAVAGAGRAMVRVCGRRRAILDDDDEEGETESKGEEIGTERDAAARQLYLVHVIDPVVGPECQ